MEAAADALPEVVGVLPSLDGDGNGEPEAVLLSPDGLRMTLDQVVNGGQLSGVTLAMIMDEQGENIMHSTGTTRSEAEVHSGLAFSVVKAHTGALDREVAIGGFADAGSLKMLFRKTEKGKLCVTRCHTLYVVLFAAKGGEDGMIKNRANAVAAALEAPFKSIWT